MPAMLASGNEENEHCNLEPIMVRGSLALNLKTRECPLLFYTPKSFFRNGGGWVGQHQHAAVVPLLLGCGVEVGAMARHVQLHASIGTGFKGQSERGANFRDGLWEGR